MPCNWRWWTASPARPRNSSPGLAAASLFSVTGQTPLTTLSVFEARQLLARGYTLNGEFLTLDHDTDYQRYELRVHDASGVLWATSLPYMDNEDASDARGCVLMVGARWSLMHSRVCTSRVYRPTEMVSARIGAYMRLLAPDTCRARRELATVCLDYRFAIDDIASCARCDPAARP